MWVTDNLQDNMDGNSPATVGSIRCNILEKKIVGTTANSFQFDLPFSEHTSLTEQVFKIKTEVAE